MKNLTNTLGIDLSSNNGDINISAAKDAGFKWAMLRVGYGNDESDQDDTRIFDYAKQCKNCDLPFGVYLMSYALNEDFCKSEIYGVSSIRSLIFCISIFGTIRLSASLQSEFCKEVMKSK